MCVYLTAAVGTSSNPNRGDGQLFCQSLSNDWRQALQNHCKAASILQRLHHVEVTGCLTALLAAACLAAWQLKDSAVGTAQRSAAQHSTAQHSTAQRSTAQHSTAQLFFCSIAANSDWQPYSHSQNPHVKVKACTVGQTHVQWYEKPKMQEASL